MLAYTERGDGPETVIMLHGFLGSGRNLGALARSWAARQPSLRFVQVDLPGHGASPPLAHRADLHSMGEAVLELATALEVPEPFLVVGHSIGGRVAITMKARAPERVGAVTLLDIAPGPTRGLPTGKVTAILAEAPDAAPSRAAFQAFFEDRGLSAGLTQWLLMNLERRDGGYHWRIDREALIEFHERTGETDLWPEAQRYASALWCVRGAESEYVTETSVQRCRSVGIDVATVPGAGHFVHVDATDEVTELLAARY